MAHLSEAELTNWTALYTATALCCAIAMSLAILVLACRLCREKVWTQLRGARQVALFLPRTWWRWQKLYLLSTPVTLAIVISFGLTLSWG